MQLIDGAEIRKIVGEVQRNETIQVDGFVDVASDEHLAKKKKKREMKEMKEITFRRAKTVK